MAYKRPGVYVQETLLQNSVSTLPSLPPGALVGATARGPLVPTNVSSWSMFQLHYGGFTGLPAYTAQPVAELDLMAHAAYQFFSNGGSNLYVNRVVSSTSAPVLASLSLADREVTTPPNVLQVDAANPGAWGNDLYVEILDSPGGTDRFNLIVRLGGTADAFIVERWTDVSVNPGDNRYLVAMVNAPGSGSNYIRVTNLLDASVVYTDLQSPAVSADPGGEPLTLGSIGGAPTTTAVGDYFQAVTELVAIPEPLVLNMPGITATALVNAVLTLAESEGDFFVIIDTARGISPSAAVTAASVTSVNASSYGAIYYPWLHVADPSNSTLGTTRLLPPGGAVLGQFASNDTRRGVWHAPAGLLTRLASTLALETNLTAADLDALNVGHVNAIRNVPGAGICVFGARTLKRSQSDKYVNVRRTLIYLRSALTDVTQFGVFENNDELLWTELSAACEKTLMELWQGGGMRGITPDEAFYVRCDAENNPDSAVANGEVHIEVGVALELPAEFIVIQIGQFSGGATVTEVVQ